MWQRLVLTVGVAVGLCGLYCVYAALTQPILALPIMSVAPVVGPVNAPPRPVENVNIARAHLAEQEWAASAQYHLKSHSAYIFTNEWEPEGTTGRVRVRPFAMVWMTKNSESGAEEPVTVVSESAVVRFAGTFELPNPNPGRLVHAILDGRAQIKGANGLVIDGKNFTFSEAAARLWSDYEVRYEYAGNRGSADILEIDLIPQVGEPGNSQPHIFGMRAVRLSRNVKMKLQLKDSQDELPLKVTCNGSFEFDVVKQQAVYTDDVVAFRQTGPTSFDWIECDRLTVQFEPEGSARPARITPVDGHPELHQVLDPRMKFHWLKAEVTSPAANDEATEFVRLFSTEHQLEARGRELVYDGRERRIRLTHPDGVQVLSAKHPVLLCPDVLLTLGAGDQLESALCRGAGWLVQRDKETHAVQYAADWKTSLQHNADPQTGHDVIVLQDAASFRQPAKELALGAEQIRVRLTRAEKPSGTASSKSPSMSKVSTPLQNVEFERLEAHDSVVLVSPQLEAQGQHLEVWLDPNAGVAPPIATREAGPLASGDAAASRTESAEKPSQTPISARAESIRVRLRPGATGQPDVADVWTEGKILLQQMRAGQELPMIVRGDRAHVENHGDTRQIVHLFGQPAHVQDERFHLEGNVVDLDRADNQFRVVGGGTLQIPVNSDLDGKTLAVPGNLTLKWQDRMAFDGMLATFRGQATATLNDRRLRCETMEVTLTQRLRFDAPPPKDSPVELRGIVCRDHVELNSQAYQANKLVEVQTAQVAELRLDRVTGAMFAQGPGVMQMWRRGDGPRSGLAPQQSATANHPIQVDPSDWQYTRVKFDGQMTGQLQHRHAVFKERVEILHGPVKLPNDKLTRENLPKGGGFMSCQELQVKQVVNADAHRHLIQLAGEGNAWLEGNGFAASADQIVYDEVRESYLLRGQGRYNARVWHNVTPGVQSTPTTFQRGEFFPSTRQIRVDAVANAEGAR